MNIVMQKGTPQALKQAVYLEVVSRFPTDKISKVVLTYKKGVGLVANVYGLIFCDAQLKEKEILFGKFKI